MNASTQPGNPTMSLPTPFNFAEHVFALNRGARASSPTSTTAAP